MHGAHSGLVALGVNLDVLDPDVLPEAQTHHIQVITTVTEGTRQLHKHCGHINRFLILLLSRQTTQLWKGMELFYDVTFSLSKIFGVQLYNALCKGDSANIIFTISNLLHSRCGDTQIRRKNIPTLSTSDTLST